MFCLYYNVMDALITRIDSAHKYVFDSTIIQLSYIILRGKTLGAVCAQPAYARTAIAHTLSLLIWSKIEVEYFVKYSFGTKPAVCKLLKQAVSQKVLLKVHNINLLLYRESPGFSPNFIQLNQAVITQKLSYQKKSITILCSRFNST